jgi:hypothetical protein
MVWLTDATKIAADEPQSVKGWDSILGKGIKILLTRNKPRTVVMLTRAFFRVKMDKSRGKGKVVPVLFN